MIYAKNEKGKTAIVENIIASIFKSKKDKEPQIRKEFINNSSKVIITGLDGKNVSFSPNSEKIDSFFDEERAGIPKSLFRLLYVKGADTQVQNESGGINKTFIKSLLSKQRVFELIKNNIPNEIQKETTVINNNIISGNKNSKYYSAYENAINDLEALRESANEFYSKLSETELLHKEKEIERLTIEGEKINSAKRYEASNIFNELQNIKNEIAGISDEDLEKIYRNISEFKISMNDLTKKKALIENYRSPASDLAWLEEAYKIHLKYYNSPAKRFRGKFIISAIILIIVSAVLMFFKLLPYAFGVLGVSIISLILSLFDIRSDKTGEYSEKAVEDVKKEFKNKFGRTLLSQADFEPVKNDLTKAKGNKEHVENEVKEITIKLGLLSEQIKKNFALLGYNDVDEKNWERLYLELKQELKENSDKKNRLELRFRTLDVDITDFIENDPGFKYSKDMERYIEEKVKDLKVEKDDEKKKFDEIRKKLTEFIGPVAFDGTYDDINEKINEKIEELEIIRKENYSILYAADIVRDIIDELMIEEDKQLEKYLNDKEIINIIKKITGKYDKLTIEDEEIIVWSKDDHFYLKNLSSGAQEQILLALRMGLSKKVTGRDGIFMILDDAFQYSDWDRRENLIGQALTMVKQGWQIIYLTMDDNIKEGFEKASKKLDKDQFSLINL